MTNRERMGNILHYRAADRMPAVHFGYWQETLAKWAQQGHITKAQAESWADGNASDDEVSGKLGFDFGWHPYVDTGAGMRPLIETRVVETRADGSYLELDHYGVTLLKKPGLRSISAEIAHSLTDRDSWERDFRHRFQFSADRVPDLSALREPDGLPRGLYLGSLFGTLRDIIGVVEISYMLSDDEELFREIIDTNASLTYECAKAALVQGARFDYAHFWEDICFKNGPLVSPGVFEECVAPHYKRITDLCREHGIDVVSLDCDGMIDHLLPIWLDSGVNTMFPIEVGTWNASIAPWRERYGRRLLGVGGMNKNAFALDRAAIDAEIERLKPLSALGGFIPCPDHRIPPDAIWENVQYYCDRIKTIAL